ncbi:Radical SAM domain protein [Flexistipes sinusarabici DSM 4947]|uniref:Radical SAM domain protein n=1 Tax=Flexistipes sinusarabici (strain ATCC 49648 / DSM 4947 / MAS 10) TaxID=717231 RepID=F8E6A5_FLESM|nr:radical SAM protein [Flexistipes sinusarabici]AEI15872.1 Radical SAM domain protein [Flexistipes sinusarabici DSM 4947]
MFANSMFKKAFIGKIADCLNGEKEGLEKFLQFYRKSDIQLDPADQNFIESLESSINNDTAFARMFLRVGKETSRSYRKKLITNLIYNHFITGKAKRRELNNNLGDEEDIVPGFIVVSPTMRCNLNCAGCYSGLYSKGNELTEEELDNLFAEVRDMGIHFIVISGGEPYILKDTLLKLFKKYDDMFFLTYTNGTLIDDKTASELGRLGNVAPAISVEGWKEETEHRRGKGMWNNILDTMGRLRKNGVLFGISVTATRNNMEEVTSEDFIEFFMDRGAIFGWYFMFMPVGKDPVLELVMTPEQRLRCGERVNHLREKYPMFLADFWNDGQAVGGCLAAGRRYLHILHNGNVEPCVFAHFGVDNIREKPLLEIVNSPFFKDIRREFPYNEKGNLKRPCMIIDNPKVLRNAVRKHNAVSGHSSPDSLVDDPYIAQWMDEYAERFAELTDPVWEEMINDPNNRWYREGREYQELFGYSRELESSGHR